MMQPAAEGIKKRLIRATKIPVPHDMPNVFPDATNLKHGIGSGKNKDARKIEKRNVFTSTPRSSKNNRSAICGRILMPPIAKNQTAIQIIHYNFTTVGLVDMVKPVVASDTTMCTFKFTGCKQQPQLAVKNKSPLLQQRKFELILSSNVHQGSNDETMPKKLAESRLLRHQQMFKSRYAKKKREDVVGGIRLNRRFDLLMKFREDAMDESRHAAHVRV